MQARYYDPVIGRFYSNDPVGFHSVYNFNRYSYAANNPYTYVDPDGRDIESVREDNHTEIKFTGAMIDRTGTYTTENFASRMEHQIENSFTGSEGGRSWETEAKIDVVKSGEDVNGRHEINIRTGAYFSNENTLGNVNQIGGNKININTKITGISPSNSSANVSFERTSAHEFGHAASLKHPTGGLMLQTRLSNSTSISKSQIDIVHAANK